MDPAPLVVTADPDLAEATAQWCAAVGVQPEIAGDLVAARRGWRRAPAVLVGGDLLDSLAAEAPTRREHVVVLDDPGGPDRWRLALAVGATAVVDPRHDHRVVELLAAALEGTGEACVVAVTGATGGVGASTLAAGLAQAAVGRDLRTLLVDGDPYGGGLDLVLGAEAAEGVRWSDLAGGSGRLSPTALVDALPSRHGVGVLTWRRGEPPAEPAVGPVLDAARRGYDVVVVDAPRGEPDHDVLARSLLTVLVVPEDVRGLAAAASVLPAVRHGASSVVVVSRPRPGGVGRAGVAEALDVPVVARLRHDPGLVRAVDGGRGPRRARRLRRTAGAVLDLLGLEQG